MHDHLKVYHLVHISNCDISIDVLHFKWLSISNLKIDGYPKDMTWSALRCKNLE